MHKQYFNVIIVLTLAHIYNVCTGVYSVEIAAWNVDHVRKGDSVHLQCEGVGTLVWEWQGERILVNSSRFTLTHHKLVIISVSHDLTGEDKPYICTNGTQNASVSIIIQNGES